MNKPLRFNIELGRTKPVNIRNEQVRCPFCDRSKLTDILDTCLLYTSDAADD